MAALLWYFLLVPVSVAFQRKTPEPVPVGDLDRVLMTFNRSYDTCKDVTDYSGHEGRAAADSACDEAFKALGRLGLNTCFGWRNPKCRFIDGDQYAQCSCTISYCTSDSIRSNIVTTFRDCAPDLLRKEKSWKRTPVPTRNFHELRRTYNDAWQAAGIRLTPSYPGPYDGTDRSSLLHTLRPGGSVSSVYNRAGSSGSGGGYFTGGASTSWGGSIAQTSYPDAMWEEMERDPKPHECEQCGDKFRSARNLIDHKRNHHTMSDTHCYMCNYTYASRKSFLTHLRKRHRESYFEEMAAQSPLDPSEVQNTLPHACRICKRRFCVEKNMLAHEKSHTTDTTTCKLCSRTLSARDSFVAHMRNVHPGAPIPGTDKQQRKDPVQCGVCGKTYHGMHSLREHEKSHNGLDTFCIFCTKNLSTRHNYKQHMEKQHPKQAHAESVAAQERFIAENPEVCDQCERRFKTERGLKDHKAFHEGRTTCDVCELTLQSLSALATHKRKEHPKKKKTKN